MVKDFKRVYHEVFDEDGNVKICGREKCKELIRLSKSVSPIYGNEENGIMNLEAIKALYVELFPNGDIEDDE